MAEVDYSTPEGQVRLLIADVSTDTAKRVLTDAQITGFLALNSGDIRRAAAAALDTIATSEVLVSKVIRTQDLATDGAKVADALHRQAQALRDQADAADDAADDGFFDVVDTLPVTNRPEHTNGISVWGL
ncbi:MAG: hypothetical protein HOW59_06120 [Nonomuraea sp.]|nr:hypothetical protein [Nonomuraea sp.]NUQ31326.1 hypothetical protein [Dermatophilaceae bacterium]NUR81048.1 hypothetical protein [Dermatophilaceae bacterium]